MATNNFTRKLISLALKWKKENFYDEYNQRYDNLKISEIDVSPTFWPNIFSIKKGAPIMDLQIIHIVIGMMITNDYRYSRNGAHQVMRHDKGNYR